MNLGDKVKKRCQWTEIEGANPKMKKHEIAVGTVVYIHPRGRFYTLEFVFPRGTFRESFSC